MGQNNQLWGRENCFRSHELTHEPLWSWIVHNESDLGPVTFLIHILYWLPFNFKVNMLITQGLKDPCFFTNTHTHKIPHGSQYQETLIIISPCWPNCRTEIAYQRVRLWIGRYCWWSSLMINRSSDFDWISDCMGPCHHEDGVADQWEHIWLHN